MVSQAGQSDEEDESDVEKPITDPKLDFPIGSRLKVKYGRGKNKKIYIAKVSIHKFVTKIYFVSFCFLMEVFKNCINLIFKGC